MKKVQLIEKEVQKEGQLVEISEELDKGYERLTGISFLDNIGVNNLIAQSSIDGLELFPKNFEVLFLQSSIYVPPDERFFTLNRPAQGKKIHVQYQDGGSARKYPYTLKIYLRLEK